MDRHLGLSRAWSPPTRYISQASSVLQLFIFFLQSSLVSLSFADRWAKLSDNRSARYKGPSVFPHRASFTVGFVCWLTDPISNIINMCTSFSCVRLRCVDNCGAIAEMKVSPRERRQISPFGRVLFFSLCLAHVGSFSCEGAAWDKHGDGSHFGIDSPILCAESMPKQQTQSAIDSLHFKPGWVSRHCCILLVFTTSFFLSSSFCFFLSFL